MISNISTYYEDTVIDNNTTELIINSNPAYPPINGWQMIGAIGTVNAKLGECTSSSQFQT